MTGTDDVSPIGGQTAESRQQVYPLLPKTIDHYELVLNEAEHSVFTERALPGEKRALKSEHHAAIKAISTAFWDTYLKEDPAAKSWLQGPEVKKSLDPKDSWKSSLKSH